ncbi:MAG: glycosyl hydrolase family 65 protein [Eubacteriales bacterium]|nr:glycosyl hydrolase family 65 protein [Eubacteriales bacterium]
MGKIADRYFGLDSNSIVEKEYDPAHSLESESIFTLSNEFMGVRGYFEEGGDMPSLRGTYLNGVYEVQPYKPESGYRGFVKRTHFMVTAADMLDTQLTLEGEALNLSRCQYGGFLRTLKLESGLFTRSFLWKTERAGDVEVRFERLLSMDRPGLLAQRITLCPLTKAALGSVMLSINGNVIHQATGKCQWTELEGTTDDLVLRTETTDISVRYRLLTRCPGKQTRKRGYRSISDRYELSLKRAEETVIERLVRVDIARTGEGFPEVADAPDFETLLKENQAHWAKFWHDGDVEIDGDPENQQGVRYCLFQLHSAYRGLHPSDNIGAKGLTGEAYNGHAFWDTETYCLPFYLLNDPNAAKALLLYRYHTLPQALERARQLDLQGACYPIATLDGTEACTLWQHSSLQMQPSTAVAYAIQIYSEQTGDKVFLAQEGAEMLCQIARYLLSRGGWSKDGFGFYGVMGPDEFHMMVDNDFYTNFMGKKALCYAYQTINSLAAKQRDVLKQKLSLRDDEPETWRQAADKMILLRGANGLFEQHTGYFSLPHTDIQAIPIDEFPLYEHWSYDRIYRTDMLKQPDVLMAMFLYPGDFTRQEKQANYEYYEPRCIHESSLSPSVHAILAGELGRRSEAATFFGFATRLDLDNYNRNTKEGLHLSSVAAAWVTIVEGFGGLRFHGGRIYLSPWLPKAWERLRFRLRVGTALLLVTVDQQEVTLVCEGGKAELTLYGNAVSVESYPVTAARR